MFLITKTCYSLEKKAFFFILISLFVLAVSLFCSPLTAHSVSIPEKPDEYVVDLAGIVDSYKESRLNAYLKELEQKTSAQFVVLTIETLDGIPIEEFALQVAEKWQLGQKDKDNGILLVIAMKERKYRFEVGYGLEGILPDAKVGSIGREHIIPHFKENRYSEGISSATLETAITIAKEHEIVLSGMPKIPKSYKRYKSQKRLKVIDIIGILAALFVIFMFGVFIYFAIKAPPANGKRGQYWRTWGGYGAGYGGFSNGGGFGGGFGGGGFGGGGGGGFGGGGASGGW